MAGRARAAAAAPATVEAERPLGPALPAQAGGAAMPPPAPGERCPRSKFLEASTLGLGAVIGGAVSVPAIGFMLVPPFLKQGRKDIDIGPITDYAEGKWQIVHFLLNPKDGEVTRRTAYIRYNGLLGKEPSFTIISNRCAHLGCPVQPNGLTQASQTKDEHVAGGNIVTLTPVNAL